MNATGTEGDAFATALEAALARRTDDRAAKLGRWGGWLVMAATLAFLRSRLLLPGDSPEAKATVLKFLQQHHSGVRNLQFASEDVYALQAAFDPKWQSAVPYTVLIAPSGKIVYERQGDIDFLELRRTILGNMPAGYNGFQKYWTPE